MITIYSYNKAEGILEKPTLEKLPVLLEADNIDVWVDLETPTPEESEVLRSVFDFHELAIEDCIETDIGEPKLDDYEDYLFIVTHSVFFQREKLSFDIVELDLFFGKNYVVTYHKKPTLVINYLKERLENKIDFMAQGTDEILHAIVDKLVDNYFTSFKLLEKIIYDIETEVLSNPTKKTINNLFKLKISLINLHRILIPGEEVMESLGKTENDLIQEENKVYFQDVHDNISNIEGLLQSYMEMVDSTMDNYVRLATHRMNKVMQTFTVLATLILIPTLIASVYGMNFDYMPFLHNEHGFFIISIVSLTIGVAMLWYFKKKDWF